MRELIFLILGRVVSYKKIIYFTLLTIILAACGGGNNGSSQGQVILEATAIKIDNTSPVPVVNGISTHGVLYIRNYSNLDIHNISYSLDSSTDYGIWQKAIKKLGVKYQAVKENSNHFILLNTKECSTIRANGYCVLNFNTPALSVGNKGSSLISLKYNDHQGKLHSYSQIVNYQYVDMKNITLAFFNASLNAVARQGETRYIVSYLIAGGESGSIYNQVSINSDNSGQASIKNGFVNGQQIAAGQVIPIEVAVKFTGNISTTAVLSPSYANTSRSNYQNKSLTLNSDLFINIIPSQSDSSLIFGDTPIINLMEESTATISIVNIGNKDVSGGSIGVTLSEGVVNNSCKGVVLLANAQNSCNITYRVTQYTPGSSQIIYTLDGIEVSNDFLVWTNDKPYPNVYITPNASNISIARNETQVFIFTINNLGNAPLNNVTFSYDSGEGGSVIQTGSSCQEYPSSNLYMLKPLSQCSVSIKFTSGSAYGSGAIVMRLFGDYNGASYTFTSSPIRYSITESPILTFTHPTASENVNLVVMANGANYESYIFHVVNTGSAPAEIGGYTLDGTPTSHVPRIDNTLLDEPCPQSGILPKNAGCNIRVVYGPEPANLAINENGVTHLVINYDGGYPNVARNLAVPINYLLKGNDSSVAPVPVAAGNLAGEGTLDSPFEANGADTADSLITLTYTNPSINYPMLNFNIDTNNLPRGLVVAGGNCPTGAEVSTIPINGGCNLILKLDKADLAIMGASNTLNSPIPYPPASWNTAAGFYEQTQVEDTNGNTSFYLEYTQAVITPIITPNPLSSGTATLSFATSNTAGYGALNINVSGVNSWLETVPVASVDCSVNGVDYSASCNLLGALPDITYFMPNYLQSGDKAYIPLYFTLNSGEYAYIDGTLKFIEYTQP